MRKSMILAAVLTVMGAAPALAQGIVVNKTDGTKVYFKANEVVSVTTYGYGEEPHAPAGAEAVDLGLPSGTKWANMNVGAEKPEDYGLYFAWGETTGYTSDTTDGHLFNWANYKWMTEGQSDWKYIDKYQVADGQTDGCWYDAAGQFIGDNQPTLLPKDDAARANWGGQWATPTYDDIRELLDNTTSEWTTVNNINGVKFTSKKNGNSIFLPAAGYRNDGSLSSVGSYGSCWSASLSTGSTYIGHILYFYSSSVDTYAYSRYYGRSVRAVLRN